MLKVMTFNLNYYGTKHGPWVLRRGLICAELQSVAPDIVALQAVARDPQVDGGADQAAQLAERLPEYTHTLFQPAMDFSDGSTGGSALLSRLPVAASDRLELDLIPGLEDDNRRVLLHARFDLPTGPLHLFNAHFSWVGEQARRNLEQAVPFFQSFAGPALLVGDFNIPAGSELLASLRQAGWRDVWAELNPGQEGLTFESNSPTLRIDYAWANPALLPHVTAIRIVADNEHATGARPSDHRGLLVTLDM